MNRWLTAGHHVMATATTTWSNRLESRSDVPQTIRTVPQSGP